MTIFVDIADATTTTQSATLEYTVSNDSDTNTESVTVQLRPAENVVGNSRITYSVPPLRQEIDTAEFQFDNQHDMQQDLCVNEVVDEGAWPLALAAGIVGLAIFVHGNKES